MEGLSSVLHWECTSCGKESTLETSPKTKFTGAKYEKLKAIVNLQATAAMISSGGTHTTLENLFIHLDIPYMSHKTFDSISKQVRETHNGKGSGPRINH